jgi:serine/threonine protein kinase
MQPSSLEPSKAKKWQSNEYNTSMDSRGRDEDLDRSVTRSITVHQLFNHPNIVQFKDYQEDNDFR